MLKKRCIETKFKSILPFNQIGIPSDILARALKFEHKCLEEATTKYKEEQLPFMLDTDPRCPYRMKPLDVRSSSHAGQLKLFLAEFWFLNKYGNGLINTLVYAGAADGRHLKFLAELFPNIHFYLYDPRPFHPSLLSVKNITIKNQIFDINDAAFYDGVKNFLFISDIRSGDPKDKTKDFDLSVRADMQNQMNWVQRMKPCYSMLKFCLSYHPGKTEYLAGQLRYGIFATQSGTEMRLVLKDTTATKIYDNTEMEERSYYFNNFTRIVRYQWYTDIKKYPWHEIGIDFCWDCCAFLRLVIDFLQERSKIDIFSFVLRIINECGASKKLLTSPHGDLYDQWLTSKKTYNGFKLYSKGTSDPKDPALIDLIYKVYDEVGFEIAPPLGEYCGPL